MNLESQLEKISQFKNLELLANQIVEGFISGMHKSPFHGFSAEFAEHKIYNQGESTKHIDWKLFAKTDRLYTKKYEEETNLRCHLIIDNSSSMHYPKLKDNQLFSESKIGFSVLASAVLMNLLKKQRDAVGVSVYSDTYEYYASEKGSERHHRMILNQFENILNFPKESKKIVRNSRRTTFIYPNLNSFRVVSCESHFYDFIKKFRFLSSTSANKTKENFDYEFASKYSDVEVVNSFGFFETNSSKIYKLSKKGLKKIR